LGIFIKNVVLEIENHWIENILTECMPHLCSTRDVWVCGCGYVCVCVGVVVCVCVIIIEIMKVI